MTNAEARRFAMYRTLRSELGVSVADTLMEHLPPTGWGDVARQGDLAAVKSDVAVLRSDLAAVKIDLESLKSNIVVLRADVDGLRVEFRQLTANFDRLRTDFEDRLETMSKSIVNEINASVTEKLNSQLRWTIGLFAAQLVALAAIALR